MLIKFSVIVLLTVERRQVEFFFKIGLFKFSPINFFNDLSQFNL